MESYIFRLYCRFICFCFSVSTRVNNASCTLVLVVKIRLGKLERQQQNIDFILYNGNS